MSSYIKARTYIQKNMLLLSGEDRELFEHIYDSLTVDNCFELYLRAKELMYKRACERERMLLATSGVVFLLGVGLYCIDMFKIGVCMTLFSCYLMYTTPLIHEVV